LKFPCQLYYRQGRIKLSLSFAIPSGKVQLSMSVNHRQGNIIFSIHKSSLNYSNNGLGEAHTSQH
jgi:hypothetical protein